MVRHATNRYQRGLSLVLRTVDLGQIYLAHATVYRSAGSVRTVSM